MRLVAVYRYQGADDDDNDDDDDHAEQLGLTDQLFEAVLCELAVVCRGQPCLEVGDFNVEPTKIPCLLKGMSAGPWVDLQGAWANASGVAPGVTCKRDWSCSGGSRRDFVLGCPLAAAALAGCWVVNNRWIQPHFAVWASFLSSR